MCFFLKILMSFVSALLFCFCDLGFFQNSSPSQLPDLSQRQYHSPDFPNISASVNFSFLYFHPRFPVHHQLWPFLPLECGSVSSSLPPWNATVMHQGCIPLHYSGIFLALLSAASLSCVEFSHLLSCWPPKQCVALVNPSFIRLSLEASAGHSPLSITSDTFPARKLHTQILSSLLWGGCALELPPLPGCPHCSPFF